MRYGTPGALRMALECRVLDMSRQPGLPLTRLRKAVVFERILARLVRTEGNWVLKGAVALVFRKKVQTRATKDLDLGYARAADDALPKIQAAARQDLGDGFVFAVERSSEISEDDPGAVRFLVRTELAGRTFENLRVDVAFGDPLIGKPEWVKGPGLLDRPARTTFPPATLRPLAPATGATSTRTPTATPRSIPTSRSAPLVTSTSTSMSTMADAVAINASLTEISRRFAP